MARASLGGHCWHSLCRRSVAIGCFSGPITRRRTRHNDRSRHSSRRNPIDPRIRRCRARFRRATNLGFISGRDFSPREKAFIEKALQRLESLTRCPTNPLKKMGKTDYLPAIPGTRWSAGGYRYLAGGYTALAENESLRSIVPHELAHALLQNLDPRTYKLHPQLYDNPLVQDFMKRTGSTRPVRYDGRPHNTALRSYQMMEPIEDMADAFMYYMSQRDDLRTHSPARAEFFLRPLRPTGGPAAGGGRKQPL